MKRKMGLGKIATVFSAIFLALLFLACKNALLPVPGYESLNRDSASSDVPQNLTATQGYRREITLEWTAVASAMRYNIYKSDSPGGVFTLIDETADDTSMRTVTQPAGTDAWYRVSAVKYNGEKGMSMAVRGTTLAQPVITDIEEYDGEVSVYWDMGNDDAYKNDVVYTVYAYNSAKKDGDDGYVVEKVVQGTDGDTSALFQNLDPHTKYFFQVDVCNRTYQDHTETEISEKKDAATARRTRPNPPDELVISKGDYENEIQISFKLPDIVYVDHGTEGVEDYYEHDLYFKIFKRKEGLTDWKTVTDYFGKNISGYVKIENSYNKTKDIRTTEFTSKSYASGDIVTFTENIDQSDRGVKYEYMVQSYVDTVSAGVTPPPNTSNVGLNNTTTRSLKYDTGWLVSRPSFYTRDHVVVENEQKNKIVKMSVGFGLNFETHGLDNKYNYLLQEQKADIPTGTQTTQNLNFTDNKEPQKFASIDEVNGYIRMWGNNSDASGQNNLENEKGYYRYTLYVVKAGETSKANSICSVDAHGKILVNTELGAKPVFEMFSLVSGYADKFVVRWKYNEDYEYILYYKDSDDMAYQSVTQSNNNAFRDAINSGVHGNVVEFEHTGARHGIERTYYLSASTGVFTIDSPPLTGKTLSAPDVFQYEWYYDKIPVKWKNNKDATRFSLNVVNAASTANKGEDEFQTDEDGNFIYVLENDELTHVSDPDYNHANKSGKDMTLEITAFGYTSEQKYEKNIDATHPDGINNLTVNDIQKISHTQQTDEQNVQVTETVHLLGPALTKPSVSIAKDINKITLKWKKIKGAKAYAVVRNSWNTPSATPNDNKVSTYLVNVSGDLPTVSNVDPIGFDASRVSVSDDGDEYTLIDIAYDGSVDTANIWQTAQARIKWGVPNDYFVLPLKEPGDAVDVDYSFENYPDKVKIANIELDNIDKVRERGAALGYGWNVTATKGIQKSVNQSNGNVVETGRENTSVTVTWSDPFLAQNQSTRYSVYRSEENKNDWRLIATVPFKAYSDATAAEGVVYEYMVGVNEISKGISTNPVQDTLYRSVSDKNKDAKWQDEKMSAGFVLPLAMLTSVSKDRRFDPKSGVTTKPPAQDIEWAAVTVGGKFNRMIDGYVLEVYNKNVDNSWHEVETVKFGKNVLNPTAKASSREKDMLDTAASFITSVSSDVADTVIKTDYKLWYRVRPITEGEQETTYSKVYKPTIANGDLVDWIPGHGDNNYIKWGTRQLTDKEFIYAATASINGAVTSAAGAWTSQAGKWYEKQYGGGKVASRSSTWVGWWSFIIQYCTTNFITVDGRIGTENDSSGNWPNYYFTNMTGGGKDGFMGQKPDWMEWGIWNRIDGIYPTGEQEGYRVNIRDAARNRIKVLGSSATKDELRASGGDPALFDGWIAFDNLNKNGSGVVYVWYYNYDKGWYTARTDQNILKDWTALIYK